jgi:adenylate cyclase class IV
MSSDMERLITLRTAALTKRTAMIKAVGEAFAKESAEEDLVFDQEHDRARDELARLRGRSRPRHEIARMKHEATMKAIEVETEEAIKVLYLSKSVTDERMTK